MGYTSTKRNVILLLNALEEILSSEGVEIEGGAANKAASGVYKDA